MLQQISTTQSGCFSSMCGGYLAHSGSWQALSRKSLTVRFFLDGFHSPRLLPRSCLVYDVMVQLGANIFVFKAVRKEGLSHFCNSQA